MALAHTLVNKGRGGLSAWRTVREAPQAHERLGTLLRNTQSRKDHSVTKPGIGVSGDSRSADARSPSAEGAARDAEKRNPRRSLRLSEGPIFLTMAVCLGSDNHRHMLAI
jgi:hypothetical protein